MQSFKPKITGIKGLSDKRRLPRLGKVRLGFKIKKGNVEYPAELPFFLLPTDVARIYGFKDAAKALERAKEIGATRQDVLRFIADNAWRLAEEIEIMFPINELDIIFQTSLKWYGGQRGVKCIGNGEIAMRYDESSKAMIDIQCPCEKLKSDENPKGECTHRGHLQCLIPKVNMGGVYQIDIGSINSIIDINSGLDYISALVGRFALIPLVLRRIPIQTHHDGKKQVHFTLQVLLNVPIDQLEGLRKDTSRILQHSQYALPAPEDINPAIDIEGEIVVEEPEEQPQEEPEEQPQEQPKEQTHEERLETAKTEEELRNVWGEIIGAPDLKKNDKQTNARRKKLNEIMQKKKTELAKPKSEIDLDVLASAIQEAASRDDILAIWEEAEPYLQGEEKVKMIRLRDLKLTEFPPEEITQKELY